MTTDLTITTNSEMVEFSDDMIKKAGELLGCKLDKASAYKALCIQRDTGLSIVRGEISVVQYGGKPVLQINKQGYLAYANAQKEYDNYEWDFIGEDGPVENLKCWVKVYRKDRTRPTYERIDMSEFNKGTATWKTMPKHMLKVRCLSLALREAFPILNGTLTEDEVEDMRAANKIEPREDDIDITPGRIESPEPKQEEDDEAYDLSAPFYTPNQIMTIQDNVKYNLPGQELTDEEILCCQRSDKNYDKAAVDMIFNKKREAFNAAKQGQQVL